MGAPETIDGLPRETVLRFVIRTAHEYPWSAWQGLDRVQAGLPSRALLATYEYAAARQDGGVRVARAGGRPYASAIVARKPMESEAFGLDVAEASHLMSPPEEPGRRDAVAELLGRLRDEERSAGTRLLVLRLHSADVDALAIAQAEGFRVVETTVTYLGDVERPAPVDDRHGLTVETFDGDPSAALSASEVDGLADATSGWRLSRFRADPHLDPEAVDRYYRSWVPNIAGGRWSDCLYVARASGELAGIYAENTDRRLLDLTGVTLREGSWLVVLTEGLGVGRALMRTSSAHRFPGGRFHQNETQAHNVATVRCLDHMTYLRSGYTLHAWLG